MTVETTKAWPGSERTASLLRFGLVLTVHVVVLAALLSWSWSPAPIEVSILSLEDLGGEMPVSEEASTQQSVLSDVAATPTPEVSAPAAVSPTSEAVQSQPSEQPEQAQQIDISLAQSVVSELVSRAVPEPEPAPKQRYEPPVNAIPAPQAANTAQRSTPDPVAPTPASAVVRTVTGKGAAVASASPSRQVNAGTAGNVSGSTQSGAAPEAPLTAVRFDADYLHNPAPAYPSQSRRLKEEGTVLLLVRVSAEGTPVSVELRQSSGFERLDEAGVQAVRQWRFVPAKRGNESVAASVLVPIQFKRQ